MISARKLLSLLGQLETLIEAAPEENSFQLRSISNKYVGKNGICWFSFDESNPYTGRSEIIATAIL